MYYMISMGELVARENVKLKPSLVVGFVVVMYNNGKSFRAMSLQDGDLFLC